MGSKNSGSMFFELFVHVLALSSQELEGFNKGSEKDSRARFARNGNA